MNLLPHWFGNIHTCTVKSQQSLCDIIRHAAETITDELVAIWKKSIPAFHFSAWAETNEEIEYKRELETEEEREKKQNKRVGCYRSGTLATWRPSLLFFAGISVRALTGCDRQSDGEIELYCWFVRLPGATQSSLVRSPASGTSDDVHHLLTSRQVSKLFSRAGICGRYTDCFTQPPPHTHTHTYTLIAHAHAYTHTRTLVWINYFSLWFYFFSISFGWTLNTNWVKKRERTVRN